MNTYTISTEYLTFIGDNHGDYNYLFPLLNRYTNTTFILLGDCGIGFSEAKEEKLKKQIIYYNNQLKKRNNFLLLIRGNHDDPSYFNSPKCIEYSYENWVFLQDYTVINYKDKLIQTIGGAVSVDRRLRKTDSTYWYGEELTFDKYIPDFITNFDILLTHTCNRKWIEHALGNMPEWLRISFKEDKKLTPDAERENKLCLEMLEAFKPTEWFCGHYHRSIEVPIWTENVNTMLKVLNCNEFYDYRIQN